MKNTLRKQKASTEPRLYGRTRQDIRTLLADGAGLTIGFPTPSGPVMLQVEGPVVGRSGPPGKRILPRPEGAPHTVALLLPVLDGANFRMGGTIWRRGEHASPPPERAASIMVDAEPGERRPGWDIFRAFLREADVWVRDWVRWLLDLVGRLGAPVRVRKARFPRQPRPIVVSSVGAPDPVAWLSALSDSSVLRVLRGSAR